MKRQSIKSLDSGDAKAEVSALARGLSLLQLVATEGPRSIKDLSAATGIPKATVSRLVGTLMAAGYLRQDDGSTLCRLGPAFVITGNAFLSDLDVREMLRPHLQNVANVAGAKVHVGIRVGLSIVVVDSVRPRDATILSYVEIGARLDLAKSAAGRAYIASLDEESRLALVEELRQAGGSSWRSTAARLDEAMAQYRQDGYSTSFGEWNPEINAIGIALRGSQGQRFVVNCGGPIYKLTPEFLHQQVAPVLLRETGKWR
jgi:DNA-binding IclR family transcriptional regulator